MIPQVQVCLVFFNVLDLVQGFKLSRLCVVACFMLPFLAALQLYVPIFIPRLFFYSLRIARTFPYGASVIPASELGVLTNPMALQWHCNDMPSKITAANTDYLSISSVKLSN